MGTGASRVAAHGFVRGKLETFLGRPETSLERFQFRVARIDDLFPVQVVRRSLVAPAEAGKSWAAILFVDGGVKVSQTAIHLEQVVEGEREGFGHGSGGQVSAVMAV